MAGLEEPEDFVKKRAPISTQNCPYYIKGLCNLYEKDMNCNGKAEYYGLNQAKMYDFGDEKVYRCPITRRAFGSLDLKET